MTNPEALKGYEGKHVKITARLNTQKKTVRVKTVEAMKNELAAM